MRVGILAITFALVPAAALAQSEQVITLEPAGLTIELPEGLVLNARCEMPVEFEGEEGESYVCEDIPSGESGQLETAAYVFVDLEQYRSLTITVRNDMSEARRARWMEGGALAGRPGSHTPTDPAHWTDRKAAAALWAGGQATGVVLYGCEGFRCYSIQISGPSSHFESDPDYYRDALAGITVHHLAAPVRRQAANVNGQG